MLEMPSMGGLLSRSAGRISLDASQIFAAGLELEGTVSKLSQGPLLDHNAIFAIDTRLDRPGQRRDIWAGKMSSWLCFQYTCCISKRPVLVCYEEMSILILSSHSWYHISAVSEIQCGYVVERAFRLPVPSRDWREHQTEDIQGHAQDMSGQRTCHFYEYQ